jgi:tol-pal system protein YbgF
MTTRKTIPTTAIATMAVLLTALLLISGCATKRDIEEINNRIARVESQNRRTQELVARVDSIIAAGADSDRQLQNDIRFTMDNLDRQISQLLENFNDLTTLLAQQAPEKIQILRNSPGAQSDEIGEDTAAMEPEPAVNYDCIAQYDQAFILVRNTEYQAAIDAFNEFLQKCPDHENVDNAHYWIGECYYAMEEFPKAIAQFELVLTQYPTSSKLPSAMYKLARSKQEMGKDDEAKALYQQLVEEHSGTLEAEQARQRLKDM